MNCFSSNCAVSNKPFASPRRQRISAGELFEKLDHVAVARQFADCFVLLFRHQRRCVETGKLLELTMKVRISKRFAESLLEDLHLRLARARREHVGGADEPESSIRRQWFVLRLGLGEAFNLGQARKAIRPVSFGYFDNRMEIQQSLFHLLGIALAEGFKRICPAVQLAALERNIDFRAAVAGDESWVFETYKIRKEPRGDVEVMPDLLGDDAHSR